MIKTAILHSKFSAKEKIKSQLKLEIASLNKIPLIKNDIYWINNQSEAIEFQELNKNLPTILIIATGGTEQFAETIIDNNTSPVILLANPHQNSLAASLEIFSYFRDDNPVKLSYYQNITEFELALTNFILVNETIAKLNQNNVGVIGNPSDWLLSSKNITSFGKFSTNLISIPVSKVSELVEENNNEDSGNIISRRFSDVSVNNNDVLNSGKVYDALNSIIKEYSLNALTIRCFDLLHYKYTACMALSYCNDDGIVSGCEGDLPALFTMMIANYLTNSQVWMANPASINKENNSVTLAHCTIPTKMLDNDDESSLTTHMESDLSTAIQGPLKRSNVTILRFNSSFDKLNYSTGRIVETNMKNPELCRTQATIILDKDVADWMNNAMGNHQVLVYGNISGLLEDFCQYCKIEIV